MSSIIALHGFLGQKTDFAALNLTLLKTINIFNTTICPLEEWARRFNRHLEKTHIIMGYSMGARLALHCLLANPDLYQASIIISAHPGLSDNKARKARELSDVDLAKSFMKEPWQKLIDAWNEQDVFKGSFKINPKENDFLRSDLSQALKYFSLGRQVDLSSRINSLNKPILWFCSQKEAHKISELKLRHEKSKIVIVEAGHRLIMNTPKLIAKEILTFLGAISLGGIS